MGHVRIGEETNACNILVGEHDWMI